MSAEPLDLETLDPIYTSQNAGLDHTCCGLWRSDNKVRHDVVLGSHWRESGESMGL